MSTHHGPWCDETPDEACDACQPWVVGDDVPETCLTCGLPASIEHGPVDFLWATAEALAIEPGHYHPSCAEHQSAANRLKPIIEHGAAK